MDDEELLLFESWVSQRWAPLLRTAYLLTGQRSDAEDLLQTVLARTWLAWDRIEDKQALDAYVRRALVNTRTSLWRRRRVDVDLTGEVPDVPAGDGGSDLYDAVWEAVRALPHKQRAAVVLRHYEGLSEAETAEVLGVSVGTVKASTSRALARLREEHPEILESLR